MQARGHAFRTVRAHRSHKGPMRIQDSGSTITSKTYPLFRSFALQQNFRTAVGGMQCTDAACATNKRH